MLLTRGTIEHEPFAWDLPPDGLSTELQEQLLHARNFSEVFHGAALLYNLILAEQRADVARRDQYRTRLASWWETICLRRAGLTAWDRNALWRLIDAQKARVPEPTRKFVNHWLVRTLAAGTLETLVDDTASRQLIAAREQWLKRGRARIGNRDASWSGDAGTAQIDYRWNRPVRAIVNDILAPLVDEDLRDA